MKILKLIILIILTSNLWAELYSQTPTIQDCAGAIPVCQGIYEQTESFEGVGNIPNEVDPFGSCLTAGEINSVWYVFTVAEDGLLSFVLTPNDPQDDYDWALYNISENDCSELATNPDLLVSCNSYGLAAPLDNGPTGMSTLLGGVGNSNGPGDIDFLPFNADLPVEAGDTYVLMVEDWENPDNVSTGSGYTLDFTNTTATIYDNVPPEITNVTLECNQTVNVEFSEPIDCTTIDWEDFVLEDENGDTYTTQNFYSNCTNLNTSTTQLSLVYDAPFTTEGSNFILHVTLIDDNVADFCGNIVQDLDYPFFGEIVNVPEFTANDIATCPDNQNGILLEPQGNFSDEFDWEWSTGDTTTSITVNETGNYQYTVSNECFEITDVIEVVIAVTPSFTSQNICGLSAIIEENQPQINGSWLTTPSGITLSQPNSNFTEVTASDFGSYNFTFTDDCGSVGSMVINFISAPEFTITSQNFCFEDGEPIVAPIGPNLDLNTWLWSNGTSVMSTAITETGLYSLTATNSCGVSSDTAFYNFLPCNLTIPNIFTPNNDHTLNNAKNDAFQIIDITKFPGSTLTVYNRWGNIIYSSSNYQNDWSPSEDEVADGSYYYILGQKFPDGTMENHSGYITILR